MKKESFEAFQESRYSGMLRTVGFRLGARSITNADILAHYVQSKCSEHISLRYLSALGKNKAKDSLKSPFPFAMNSCRLA